ncbi:MAG: ChaN family lipoprotein [Bacteroidota bacterium]
MRTILLSCFLISSFHLTAQDIQAYQLYTKKGEKTSFKKVVKHALQQDVILFGEQHNNAMAHWIQLELVKALHERDSIAIGAEMLEADNQDELDDYMNRKIDAKAFDTLARLWSNYQTDYRPIVDFARENNLPFVATNIPRRYARLVYKRGFDALDSLSNEEKGWIAPLPVPYDPSLPGYQKMMEMMPDHANENFPKAQAIKDATMAHFMVKAIQRTDNRLIHLNGAFHSNNFDGIYWYLKQYAPDLNIGTISTVEQAEVARLDEENRGLADFILVVDEDVTKTY